MIIDSRSPNMLYGALPQNVRHGHTYIYMAIIYIIYIYIYTPYIWLIHTHTYIYIYIYILDWPQSFIYIYMYTFNLPITRIIDSSSPKMFYGSLLQNVTGTHISSIYIRINCSTFW